MNELKLSNECKIAIKEDKPIVDDFKNYAKLVLENAQKRKNELKHGEYRIYLDEVGLTSHKIWQAKRITETIANLSNMFHGTHLPENERQMRELIQLEPDKQIEVWEAVTERYEPKEITAKIIKQVKQEILEPEIEVIENEFKEEIFNTPEVNFKALQENINPVYDALSQVYKQALKEKVKQSFCEWLSLYVESFK